VFNAEIKVTANIVYMDTISRMIIVLASVVRFKDVSIVNRRQFAKIVFPVILNQVISVHTVLLNAVPAQA
jgi:hypothetical protein